MIQKAQDTAYPNNCHFEHAYRGIPFEDKSFSLVMVCAVFAHILDEDMLTNVLGDIYVRMNRE